jgi:hypothetical protein
LSNKTKKKRIKPANEILENLVNSKGKNLVAFSCSGNTLVSRKNCKFYVHDPDSDTRDCLNLREPESGKRFGLCFGTHALIHRCFTYMEFAKDTLNNQESQEDEKLIESQSKD